MANNGKNNARMIDLASFINAGFDPKTGLPKRFSDSVDLKQSTKLFLRIIDEQDAVNRYKWENIPFKLSSEEIERLLYYKGQLAAFYFDEVDEFYLMPFALDGTIDFYGRYNYVKPVPFGSSDGSEDEPDEDRKRRETMLSVLSDKTMRVEYQPLLPDEVTIKKFTGSCVILQDYTKQIPQSIIPRWQINDGILDVMADIVPFLRTSMALGTGVKGVRVQDSDQAEDVMSAAKQVIDQARKTQPWIPLTGAIEFQELADGPTNKAEDFLLTMQALDNIRLQGYGLPNGGIFEKKAHILEAENAMNQQAIDRIYQDGLSIRQHFCLIFNSIFGTSLWCMPSESVLDADINGDGLAVDMENADNGREESDDAGKEVA